MILRAVMSILLVRNLRDVPHYIFVLPDHSTQAKYSGANYAQEIEEF